MSEERHEPGSREEPEGEPIELEERPLFQHRPWMVGVVLVFAVLSAIAGLQDPVWWLIGGPFILAAVIWLWVSLTR